MPSSKTSPLLVALMMGLVAVGGGFAYWLTNTNGQPLTAVPDTGGASNGPEDTDQEGTGRTSARLEQGVEVPLPGAADSDPSTVLWPLEVRLEQESSAAIPRIPGAPPFGAGASARLTGRIVDAQGVGVAARVSFIAGPNEGRELLCDSTGSFGATNLLPGLNLVTVSGPGILGSKREVRLRRNTEQILNIGYGRPATMYLRVLDKEGEPIEHARVHVDGQLADPLLDGNYFLSAVASGKSIVEIEAEGFAALREGLNIMNGTTYAEGQLEYRLERPATLEISIPEAVGGPGPARVIVLPSNTKVARTFPWYTVNPIEMRPGSTFSVEGLPPVVVLVRVFHEGAIASPKTKSVRLRAGDTARAEIHLEPAPVLTGTVTDDKGPVADATVTLQPPDQVAATLAFLRETQWYLETEVMPSIPPAFQQVRTDAQGHFVLTAWDELAPTRMIEAVGPDGELRAARLVEAGTEEVSLELTRPEEALGTLAIHMPGRFQALPVEVRVNGAPREPFELPEWESLVIDDLDPGTWRVRIRWYSQELLPETLVEIDAETGRELKIELPQAALDGHDEDTWRRAGRDYPRRS